MAGKILITPNAGSTTVDPTIKYQGISNSTDITQRVTSTGSLSFEGTSGQLFSITDSMSGTIYSVNDVSGIPSIEVLDTGLVKIAQYSGNLVIGSATDNAEDKLQVTGSGKITGGSAMTSGWNRTLTLESSFPGLIFNSSNTKWASINYDHTSNFVIRVGATSKDTFGSGVSAISINSTTGVASFSSTISASNFSGSHSGASSGTNTGDQTLPTWSTLSGKPTNLSSFTNDLGNYGGWITATGSTTGTARGLTRSDSAADTYNVQSWWDGARWELKGYSGTTYHAGVKVDYATTSGTASSANAVAWTNVSSRPTNLSSFTNDLGNYGGWITSSGTSAACSGNAATATTATTAYFLASNVTGTTCATIFQNTPAGQESSRECNGWADAPNTGRWIVRSLRHTNSSNYWGTQIAYGWEDNANAIYQRNVSGGVWTNWTRVDVSSANITELVNNAGFITSASIPSSLPANGGNADTVDSQHFTWSNSSNAPTYVWGADTSGSSYLAARGSMSVNYANTAGALTTGNNYQVNSLGVGAAASGTAGEIRATNNVTAYYSDDRLKTRTGVIENALDKISTLDTFYYHANETAQALGYQPIDEVGISAQQVQAIMPQVVAPAPIDDKYLTVRYERLVPLLIAAIKEQQVQIEELKQLIKNK